MSMSKERKGKKRKEKKEAVLNVDPAGFMKQVRQQESKCFQESYPTLLPIPQKS